MARPQRHFDRGIFEAHLIRENDGDSGFRITLFQHEEEELERIAENEFQASYWQELKKAREQAEDEWYPYRAAEIFGNQEIDLYESSEVDEIIKTRRSELQKEVIQRHINGMFDEIMRARER